MVAVMHQTLLLQCPLVHVASLPMPPVMAPPKVVWWGEEEVEEVQRGVGSTLRHHRWTSAGVGHGLPSRLLLLPFGQ